MNELSPNRQLLVSLDAVEHNLATLSSRLPADTRLMPMVKANGYGTDICQMATTAFDWGADIVGVAYVSEAQQLRDYGITGDIFICQPNADEFPQAVDLGVHMAVMSASQIDALNTEAAKQERSITVHLKINSGLNRFGCAAEDALELAQMIDAAPQLHFDGVMTHFASADDPYEDSFTLQQVATFDRCIAELEKQGLSPKWRHAANSAGILRFQLPQYNMARPGIACLGIPPSAAAQGIADLKVATELHTRIVHINLCHPGDTVSYARSYRCSRPLERIAAIPVGYADGIHWSYRNKGYVLIGNSKAPLVGNICMDSCLIDITNIPHAQVGDTVTIIGNDLPPTQLANQWGTIPYQILVGLGARIHRKFIKEGKA